VAIAEILRGDGGGPRDRSWLIEQLQALGRLSEPHPSNFVLAVAVRDFQRDAGLVADGWAGPQTLRALVDPRRRFCGVRFAPTGRWNRTRITWAFFRGSPELLEHVAPIEVKKAFAAGWAMWSQVCGIEPVYTTHWREADVVISAGELCGKEVATSEVLCCLSEIGLCGPLEQRFAAGETWSTAHTHGRGEPGPHEFELAAIAGHMAGHAIGLPHLAAGSLMASCYEGRILRPTPIDAAAAAALYGEPQEPLPPDDHQTLAAESAAIDSPLEQLLKAA
jgi:hypothetical protein